MLNQHLPSRRDTIQTPSFTLKITKTLTVNGSKRKQQDSANRDRNIERTKLGITKGSRKIMKWVRNQIRHDIIHRVNKSKIKRVRMFI